MHRGSDPNRARANMRADFDNRERVRSVRASVGFKAVWRDCVEGNQIEKHADVKADGTGKASGVGGASPNMMQPPKKGSRGCDYKMSMVRSKRRRHAQDDCWTQIEKLSYDGGKELDANSQYR